MDEKPKRRWHQVSLRTALIALAIAGPLFGPILFVLLPMLVVSLVLMGAWLAVVVLVALVSSKLARQMRLRGAHRKPLPGPNLPG